MSSRSEDIARIVNLSGGKDSTAMLLWLIERKEPFDAVIFMDTGWEFPAMYAHLDKLQKIVGGGVEIHRVTPPYSFDWYLTDYCRVKGKLKNIKGYGFATLTARWCTALKRSTISAWIKQHFPMQRVCHYIGIAADERARFKQEKLDAGEVRYPLVEWGKTEADCMSYCRSFGFDWGGEYEKRNRLSCWCCPLQSLRDLKLLYERHPELWLRLKDMQARSIKPFRMDYTLDGLEVLFRAGIEY